MRYIPQRLHPIIPPINPQFNKAAKLEYINYSNNFITINCMAYGDDYNFPSSLVKTLVLKNSTNTEISLTGTNVNWYGENGNENGVQFIIKDELFDQLIPQEPYQAYLQFTVDNITYMQKIDTNGIDLNTNLLLPVKLSNQNNNLIFTKL